MIDTLNQQFKNDAEAFIELVASDYADAPADMGVQEMVIQ